MPQVLVGGTRLVVLATRWAFKVPRVDNGGRVFVLGLLANLNEHDLSRQAKGDRRVATTRWCAPLGLFAVAERITGSLIGRRLTENEAFSLPFMEFSGECGVDDNGHNVVRRDDGSLVVVDYGNAGLMYVPEGPQTFRGLRRGVVSSQP